MAERDFPCYVWWTPNGGMYADNSKYWAIGVVDDIDDYYWVAINDHGRLEFHSCVGGYEVCEKQTGSIDDKLLSDEFVQEVIRQVKLDISDTGKAWLEKLGKRKGSYKKLPRWEKIEKDLKERIERPLESKGLVYLKIKRESD